MREAMRDKGKAVETYNSDYFADYYSFSYDFPCMKHPSASSVGICAYCLKDRLSKLACSECGQQRLSSCSCSDFSSDRNSCTGEVGRVSFLMENGKRNLLYSNSELKTGGNTEDVLMLKRSSSSCIEIKKNGFWKIGKFFRKKKEKGTSEKKCADGCDEKSYLSTIDYMGVSRSRSLSSFGGGEYYHGSDTGDYLPVSAARSSISAARSSNVTGGLILDAGRKSYFSEAEPRRSGFSETEPIRSCFSESENRKSCFSEAEARRSGCCELDPRKSSSEPEKGIDKKISSLKESDFNSVDDSRFIDLKIDLSSELNKENHSNMRTGSLSDIKSVFGSMRTSDLLAPEFGGSCRITVSDRGINMGRKSFKGWRWIFKQLPNEKQWDK